MFCPKCGNKVIEGSAFCSKCGFKVGVKVDNNISPSNHFGFNISKIPFVAILCTVAIVVLCIFGYNQFNNRTCKLCGEKVYKEGLCKEHYTKTLAMDNLNDVINGEKEFGDAIKDVYDKSLTKDEKKQLEDSFEGLKNSFNEIGKLLK